MPKYHWLPFFDWLISGSRCCAAFFVEGEAAIRVAAAAQQLTLRRQVLGNGLEDRVRRVMTLEQTTEVEDRRLVGIALANKMARQIWAMLSKKEDYRDPALATAA